ncbi:hypothetical protein DYU11_23135 [Fibrisoma montanum]|uniref:Uncharacterized protein n=1 Tax=Fibrisoma montanum TaxID=2305895 RepID=A0A418M2C3_9BACT|nr:hypothetical protein [Fibrisoma montanum]RIV19824.1 hypothetical protein DYU11_23135 [Fibrisoma montanum]
MKTLLSPAAVLIGVALLTGCQPAADFGFRPFPVNSAPTTPQTIPTTVVKADSTDEPGNLQLTSIDWRIISYLHMEENYPLTDNSFAFTLNKGFYMARIQGREGIYDSRVNGRYMCTFSHNDCDSTKSKPSSLWDRIGQVNPSSRRLVWTFADQQKKQGYQFEMSALPRFVNVVSAPDTIRLTGDNTFRIAETVPQDSLVVEVMILEPDEPARQRVIPFINNTKTQLRVKAVNNAFTLPVAPLRQLIEFTRKDVTKQKVYLNVSAIRQVIKRIGTKKVMLTYQVSNWRQVYIR